MKSAFFALILAVAPLAHAQGILLSCASQKADGTYVGTQWIDGEPGLEKTYDVDGKSVSVYQTTAWFHTFVVVTVGGEQDELEPKWNNGANVTVGGVTVNCYYQHDD